jgi:hypothetical protein
MFSTSAPADLGLKVSQGDVSFHRLSGYPSGTGFGPYAFSIRCRCVSSRTRVRHAESSFHQFMHLHLGQTNVELFIGNINMTNTVR